MVARTLSPSDVRTVILDKSFILAKIIQRITVKKDYKIHIQFFFTQERMMEAFRAANIQISEAKTWYIAGA